MRNELSDLESGVDIWVQKPISRDVLEGKAMLAAARHNNRVVQVGLQRRSTPHLVEAKERFVDEGKLGKIALVEIYCCNRYPVAVFHLPWSTKDRQTRTDQSS